MSTRIAFIGLGNMGLPMALNLLRHGHVVAGHDLVASNGDKLAAAGGLAAPSAAAAVEGAEVVITMLPASQHVEAAYLDEGGILDRATPGTLLIDCSTIDVASARAVIEQAVEHGLAAVVQNKVIDILIGIQLIYL